MKRITSRELFWSRALGSYTEEAAVSWAVAELERQPATPNLAALAGLTSPYNRFEVEDLLHRALSELGIEEPSLQHAYLDFLCTTGRAVLDGTLAPREGCAKLARAHGGDLSRREVQPFWLLDLGHQDLQAGQPSWHYAELTMANFDDLVRRECSVLIQKACGEIE
jgi:hypothetical protein